MVWLVEPGPLWSWAVPGGLPPSQWCLWGQHIVLIVAVILAWVGCFRCILNGRVWGAFLGRARLLGFSRYSCIKGVGHGASLLCPCFIHWHLEVACPVLSQCLPMEWCLVYMASPLGSWGPLACSGHVTPVWPGHHLWARVMVSHACLVKVRVHVWHDIQAPVKTHHQRTAETCQNVQSHYANLTDCLSPLLILLESCPTLPHFYYQDSHISGDQFCISWILVVLRGVLGVAHHLPLQCILVASLPFPSLLPVSVYLVLSCLSFVSP